MKPLVSILIHNYNYGRYLHQCFRSIFEQGCDDIEIVFADNASDDKSWKTAHEFLDAFPGKIMLIRQSRNRGSEYNSHTVSQHIHGDYFCRLCSDDALAPGFIKQTVESLKKHKNASFAMVHRSVMDANSKVSEEIPFYNRSCVIPGREQAKVYMMSSVTPSISQVMYRTDSTRANNMGLGAGSLTSRCFGPRIQDFNLCFAGDVIYIKDPLLYHRVHADSDSAAMLESMVEPIGQYLLIHQLAAIAESYGADDVAARLPEAIEKHAGLCVRYAMGAIANCNLGLACRYLSLAEVSGFKIKTTQEYNEVISGIKDRRGFINYKTAAKRYAQMSRTESYDPPEGSVEL